MSTETTPPASATTCRARWKGGACAEAATSLGLCPTHNRRRLRAEAAGKSRAEVEAAIARPARARAGVPQVALTTHVPGATHDALVALAEARGLTLHGLTQAALTALAEEE